MDAAFQLLLFNAVYQAAVVDFISIIKQNVLPFLAELYRPLYMHNCMYVYLIQNVV